jgi:hypothetical protein
MERRGGEGRGERGVVKMRREYGEGGEDEERRRGW